VLETMRGTDQRYRPDPVAVSAVNCPAEMWPQPTYDRNTKSKMPSE